jgi:hypothetical protein
MELTAAQYRDTRLSTMPSGATSPTRASHGRQSTHRDAWRLMISPRTPRRACPLVAPNSVRSPRTASCSSGSRRRDAWSTSHQLMAVTVDLAVGSSATKRLDSRARPRGRKLSLRVCPLRSTVPSVWADRPAGESHRPSRSRSDPSPRGDPTWYRALRPNIDDRWTAQCPVESPRHMRRHRGGHSRRASGIRTHPA